MKRRVAVALAILALSALPAVAATIAVPGDQPTIQDAITAASAGDVIAVSAGTYQEQLYIDKSIDLMGAGAGLCTIEAPDAVDRSTYTVTQWTGSMRTVDAVVGVNVAGTVNISGFTVDGRDTGPDDYYGIHYFDTSGAIMDCTVTGITYPAGPGSQRVVSIVATHSDGTPIVVDLSDNLVPDFQKGGILVMGPECTFTVDGNTVMDVATPEIAGNGIQLAYGASGSTAGNVVQGVGYTGSGWAGTGILLFESGDISMDGDEVFDCQSGVNYSDWRWVYSHPVPVNIQMENLDLHDNEWSLGAQLSGDESDLNIDITGCTISGSAADGLDLFGTDAYTGYYTGWQFGDLVATITDCTISNTAAGYDGLWTGDFSGNTNNASVTVRGTVFANNGNSAVNNDFPTAAVDAAQCYWNDAGGPVDGGPAPLVPRSSRPIVAPIGVDLPASALVDDVLAEAGDRAGETFFGNVLVSPYLAFTPGTTPMTWGVTPAGTIQAAIDLASAGDTIDVGAGTYPEMVSVNKSLTLLGANAGVHPAVGTHPTEVVGVRGPESELSHNGLYALHPDADDITVDGFLFSGDGGRIIDTYADANGFHLTNCIFDNGAVATSTGVIQFGGGSHTGMTLDFNLFQDQGDHTFYTGGGPFDGLTIAWNNISVGADFVFWTATPLVDGVIQGNEWDGVIGGTPGAGWGTVNIGQAGNLQVLDNYVHDITYTAFQVGMVGGTVSGNLFENIRPYPGYFGDCFELWGGQYGTAVSTNVSFTDNVFNFNDVSGQAEPVHGVRLRQPDTGSGIDGTTLQFRDNEFLDGYEHPDAVAIWHQGDTSLWADAIDNWWGDSTGPYHAALNPGGLGARVGDFVDFVPWTGQAILGMTAASGDPINCAGSNLLTFSFTPDAMTPEMLGFTIRVTATSEVSFTDTDITVNADLVPGHAETHQIVQNGTNDYTIDWAVLGGAVGLNAAADLFTIDFHGDNPGADGTATVAFGSCDLRDLSNQPIGVDCSASQDIDVDCVSPASVTGITATPGHQKVELSWTNPGDADLAGTEIWRALYHDGALASSYPEYGSESVNIEPGRPADRAAADLSNEWTLVHTALAGETSWTDASFVTGRGIYYYELFPVDTADNIGPVAPANDRATNYWLGDVSPALVGDGLINLGGDITILGSAYGTINGGVDYNNECDVGPTDTALGDGIPLPDNQVGFEDLMIFAQNYGNVAPRPAYGSDIAMLSWFQQEDGDWALALTEPCSQLKALRLTASLPAGMSVDLGQGGLLGQQAGPVFLRQIEGDRLDVSLALMGRDLAFAGQGVLFTLHLADGIQPGDLELAVRSTDNAPLDFVLSDTAVAELPSTYRLVGNFPNPFNPKTSIAFDLPEAQFVKLTVFSADGRLIRTLLDRRMDAGHQEVVWAGRDASGAPVASGIYFARIEAGPLSATHKMLLMK